MQEIPDTGGGLSGFIAWLLWQVYVYFPFEGTWDWLLLIVFLAVLARTLMIPVWWRVMKRPGLSSDDRGGILALVVLGDLFWPWLVIWLFNTSAGQTLVPGRYLEEPIEWSYAWSVGYHFVVLMAAGGLAEWLETSKGRSSTIALVGTHSLVAVVAHYYQHWCVASRAVFALFSITALLTVVTVEWLAYVYHVDLDV